MLTDTYGRGLIATDPDIGFREQVPNAQVVDLSSDDAEFDQAVVLASSASGIFSVTTLGGKSVAIPWSAYTPLPVLITTVHRTGTTATGIVAYW
jgi:hypothetical protein